MSAIPNALHLDPAGRLFLLSWLRGELLTVGTITAESWREAYGRAADYETVCNARRVLGGAA